MSTDITTLGLGVRYSEVDAAKESLQGFTKAGEDAAKAAEGLGEASDRAAKRAEILARHAGHAAEADDRAAAAKEKYNAALGESVEKSDEAGSSATLLARAIAAVGDSAALTAGAWTALAGGIALAEVGFLKMVAKFTAGAAEANDFAQSLQIGVDKLGGLKAAFEASNMGAGEMRMALSSVSRQLEDSDSALSRYGVSLKNADGTARSQIDALGDLAEKFRGAADGAEKAAIAAEIFGNRLGPKMIPLLNEGRQGLIEYKEIADRLGLTIGTDVAEAADKLESRMSLLSQAAGNVLQRAFYSVVGASAEMADELVKSEAAANLLSIAVTALSLPIRVIGTLFSALHATAAQAALGIGGLAAAIAAAGRGDFSQSWTIAKETVADLGNEADKSGKRIASMWGVEVPGAAKAASTAFGGVSAEQAKAAAAGAKYVSGLERQTEVMGYAAGAGAKLSKSEKELYGLMADLRDGTKVLTDEQKQRAIASLQSQIAIEKESASTKKSTAGVKDQQKALADLKREQAQARDAVEKYTDKVEASTGWQAGLTRAQRDAMPVLEALRDKRNNLTEAEKIALANTINQAVANETLEASRKAEQAAMEAHGKELAKVSEARNRENVELGKQIEKLTEENARIGLTKEGLIELERKRLDDAIAIAEQNYQKALSLPTDSAELAAITLKVDQLKKLKDLREKGIITQATVDTAKEASDAWSKTVDDIGKGLTDSLFRAFESGKSFFSALWDGIKNVFKTTVLKMLIQPVQGAMTSVVGSALSGLGLGGFSGAAGANPVAGGAGNIVGMGGLLGGMGAFGTGASYGLASLFGGSGMAALGGAGSMIGAGSVAAGLGTIAGVLGPIGAAVALLSSLSKKSTPHVGGTATADALGAREFNPASMGWHNATTNAETVTGLKGLASGVANALNSLSSAFGKTGGYGVNAGFAADNDDPSWGYLGITKGGAAVGGWSGNGGVWGRRDYAADSKQGYEQYLGDVASSTKAAIASIGLPEWAQRTVDALGGAPTIEQLAQATEQIAQTQASLVAIGEAMAPLGGVFSQVALLSGDATIQLAGFAGGMDALISKTQAYVQAYYTEAEKAALQASGIRSALEGAGITTDLSTKDQLRALVDSTNVSTEDGRRQLAALLDVAAGFADLSVYMEKTGQTLSQLADTAPQAAVLETAAQANEIAQQTVDGIAVVADNVKTTGDTITSAVHALQASVEAGLTSVALATAATERLLRSWDDGGRMTTVVEA